MTQDALKDARDRRNTRSKLVIDGMVLPMKRYATATYSSFSLLTIVLVLFMDNADRYPFIAPNACFPCECDRDMVIQNCNLAKEVEAFRELKLYSKGITAIADGAFADLFTVRVLSLYNNSISTIEQTQLQGLDNTKIIFLNFNKLESLDPVIFVEPTQQLGYLWVTGNNNATCETVGRRGGLPDDVVCVDDTVCTVKLPYLLADGICNGEKDGYKTAECHDDGGDCKGDNVRWYDSVV
eukprot:CAMPEP_0182548508 /NCGR_PEP_ID=MMETSP1323-20130603/38895_1 /TAXON_ID=236787 /ORGANISM="Florenciella parvula, Strain RCC1693" /LENGTH=238 /DNA_ID=CAMNT_0024759905 /DNA_START=124 /DNA_END=840 /DNA_ORIENTATION=-